MMKNAKIQRISMVLYALPRNQVDQDARCNCTFFQFHPSCLRRGRMEKDDKNDLSTYLSDLERALVLK